VFAVVAARRAVAAENRPAAMVAVAADAKRFILGFRQTAYTRRVNLVL
jgi:hypothetical protein